MKVFTLQPLTRSSLCLLAVCALLLFVAPGVLDTPVLTALIQENGLVEGLSVIGWLTCATYVKWYGKSAGRTANAFAVVFVMLAIREAGLPSLIASNGKELVTLGYYLDSGHPVMQRVVMGAVLLLAVAALVQVCSNTLRYLWHAGGLCYADGQMLVMAFVVIVFSQGCEEISSHHLFVVLPGSWDLDMSFLAMEEGLECLASVLVLTGLRASVGTIRRERLGLLISH